MRLGNGQNTEPHGAVELNARQLDLVFYALRHPGAEFSTHSHQCAQGIDEQTARADLHDLEEKGYLVRHQIGPAYVFYAAEDLELRVGGLT